MNIINSFFLHGRCLRRQSCKEKLVGDTPRITDPGLGVIRHADAGYDVAKDFARKFNLDLEKRLSF